MRRALALLVALALLAGLAACDRETRDSRGTPLPENAPSRTVDARAKRYEGNAFHIAQGARY